MPSALAIIPQVLKNKPGSLRLLEAAEGAALRPALPPQPRRSANGVGADKARRSLGDCTANAPAGDPSGAALGRYGRIVSAPVLDAAGAAAVAVVERFRLQNAARRLLPMEGVAGCLRRRQGGKEFVDLWHLPEVGRAKYGGLQTCSSVWACPVCAAKISERRRIEVRQAIDAWAAMERPWFGTWHPPMVLPPKLHGGDIVLVTLTVRHYAGDNLAGLLNGLKEALRQAHMGREGLRFASDFGVRGSITGTETTWGEDNGYHPHLHQLLFVEPGCPFDKLWIHYRQQWEAGLSRCGMRDVTMRGVDLTWAKADVADYVTKIGAWDIEHELTKSPVKKGKEGRYSPMQLLASFADYVATPSYVPRTVDPLTGEVLEGASVHPGREHGRIWQNYALVMKRRHQLQWSRGLRNMLGLGKEKSNEELAEEKDSLGVLLAQLDRRQWATVLHFDARADLLNVAACGDAQTVSFFLQDLDLRWLEQEAEERRTKRSCSDSVTRWDDQREAEAEELGLTRSEYLRWRHGGVDAMANENPGVDLNAPVSTLSGEVLRGNSSTLKVLGRRLVAFGRGKVAALPLLTSGDVDEGSDVAGVEYGSNGYSERFRGL